MTGQSVNFFLTGSGKIVKNEEVLLHLEYLETRADNGGFSSLEFGQLSRVLMERPMPAQISRRFVNCLVPHHPVQGDFTTLFIIWHNDIIIQVQIWWILSSGFSGMNLLFQSLLYHRSFKLSIFALSTIL